MENGKNTSPVALHSKSDAKSEAIGMIQPAENFHPQRAVVGKNSPTVSDGSPRSHTLDIQTPYFSGVDRGLVSDSDIPDSLLQIPLPKIEGHFETNDRHKGKWKGRT